MNVQQGAFVLNGARPDLVQVLSGPSRDAISIKLLLGCLSPLHRLFKAIRTGSGLHQRLRLPGGQDLTSPSHETSDETPSEVPLFGKSCICCMSDRSEGDFVMKTAPCDCDGDQLLFLIFGQSLTPVTIFSCQKLLPELQRVDLVAARDLFNRHLRRVFDPALSREPLDSFFYSNFVFGPAKIKNGEILSKNLSFTKRKELQIQNEKKI